MDSKGAWSSAGQRLEPEEYAGQKGLNSDDRRQQAQKAQAIGDRRGNLGAIETQVVLSLIDYAGFQSIAGSLRVEVLGMSPADEGSPNRRRIS